MRTSCLIPASWVLMMAVLGLAMGAHAQSAPSLLIPIYDRFQDVGVLVTPTYVVEMNSVDTRETGSVIFSAFHGGKAPSREKVGRVLFTLCTDAICFSRHERASLIVLADERRIVLEDVEFPQTPSALVPLRDLRVWIPMEELALMSRAKVVECRSGRFEFTLPAELVGQLRHLDAALR